MKKILVFLLVFTNFLISSLSQEILVNVYVMGLDKPIQRIVRSELSTQEQLELIVKAIERDYLASNKYGISPVYALLDNMIEDIKSLEVPDDSEVVFMLYTDAVNTNLDRRLFVSPEAQQYVNNKAATAEYVIRAVKTTHVNGKPITVMPILIVGGQKESDTVFLQRICSPGERVYHFDEAELIHAQLLRKAESSSSLVLCVVLDHSGSMAVVKNLVGANAIETIQGIYQKKHETEKAKNRLGINDDDFLHVPGGPSFVGSRPSVRPDEIFFTFTLSEFKIAKAPVIQTLYDTYAAMTGQVNRSKILNGNSPITNLSYYEVLAFIDWLNEQWKGPGRFRLPTEYELEHVFRLRLPGFSRGEPSAREFTNCYYADYDTTEKNDPKGNPRGTHVVVRGVSYEDSDPMMNRPEYRGRIAINESSPLIGFRLVLCE